ncbi:MAG: hypothetical protein M1817_000983 [Caeruleum heppii]|nr:MAG: hypothetical protein M1817_000983 [Caeruleum heppii]
MSSSVFFKFKSQKEPTRVTFDGTGISVFELKRSIIEINKLGDGTDFDLAVYNEDTNEEYDDDTSIVPRSTSIIARRLPPRAPGRGGAARYVSGKMPVNALSSSWSEKSVSKPATSNTKSNQPSGVSNMQRAQTEEERIAAMFQAGAEQWDQQQQDMANATPVFRGGPSKGKPMSTPVPNHPPPSGYICYRCGEKGHWIQECPTNNDPEFDNRPRVKRTTGIPKSFLKTVQKPAALSGDGSTEDGNKASGVMVNAEGDFVVAEPDKASWDQYQAKAKVSANAQEAADTGDKDLQEKGLECPIDKRLFVEPTKTPCCERTYCNDCITNALIENDLTCPGCQNEGILIDNLTPNEEVASKIEVYLKTKVEARPDKGGSKSPIPESNAVDDATAKDKSADITASPKANGVASPKASITENVNSRKRPAEAPLPAQRVPNGPSGMQSQTAEQMRQVQNQGFDPQAFSAMMNGGFPSNGGPNPFNMGLSGMPFPNGNGFMGMPGSMGPMMAMNPAMMDPMSMGFVPGGPGVNGMGGPGFHNGPQGMYGLGMAGGMMANGAYGGYGQYSQGPMGQGTGPLPMSMQNGGMPGMNNGGGSYGNRQMQSASMSSSQEDNAYFRQPVNPHRHQARQRRMRPSDYHEL